MLTINIHDAKTQLSKLLVRVESGEEIIIARGGKPVARIIPLENRNKNRRPGSAKGRFRLTDDFFAPLPDNVIDEFER